jgi:AcrR family transcriptional regulator
MTDWPVIIYSMPRLAPAQRAALGAERREQILEAAVRLWTGHGFEATTLESIAREAGIAKGTIYLYFATKEDLVAAAVERWSLVPDLAGIGPTFGDLPLDQAIPRLAELLWARLRGSAPLVGLLLRELVLRPAEARTFLESVVLPVNGAFAAFLEARVRTGEVRAVDTFVAARAFIGMLLIFVWTQHVLGGDAVRPIDGRAIVATASDLFLRGLLAPRAAPLPGARPPSPSRTARRRIPRRPAP